MQSKKFVAITWRRSWMMEWKIEVHIHKTINFQTSKAHLCTSKMFITEKSNFDLIQAELALLLAFDISVSDFYAIYQYN